MGGVSSYLASVILSWVANNVGFAGGLPLFRKPEHYSTHIGIDSEAIDRMRQSSLIGAGSCK